MIKKILSAGVICTLLIVSGCAPTRTTHGNLLTEDRIAKIEEGVSTQRDVYNTLGSPTFDAAFAGDIWYYVGMEGVKQGFMDEEFENKQIYVAEFDDKGVLNRFEQLEPDDFDVPIVDRKTKTYGNEFTLLEQLIGNVGRFNSQLDESNQER